jgi:hypothetical protein
MYLQKVPNKQKKTFFNTSFLFASGRLMTKIAGPDPLVRGMDPGIRIYTKMSWIPNIHRGIRKLVPSFIFVFRKEKFKIKNAGKIL